MQLTSESYESEKRLHKNRSAQTHPQIAHITAASVVVWWWNVLYMLCVIKLSFAKSKFPLFGEPELTAAHLRHRAASALTATGSVHHASFITFAQLS